MPSPADVPSHRAASAPPARHPDLPPCGDGDGRLQPEAVSRRSFLGAAPVGVALASSATGAAPSSRAPMPDKASPPAHGAATAFSLNGERFSETLDPRVTLVDLLRERLGLTGTKKGCDHGSCGSCTVHIRREGEEVPTRQLACLTFAATLDGATVTTIEGLPASVKKGGDELHPLQEAFLRCDAYQCGYCTPGQIMSAAALLAEDPAGGGHVGSREEVREWMSGNLCRCGAYPNIVAAVRQTAGEEPSGDPSEAVTVLSAADGAALQTEGKG